jgi:hypothetical protein
MRSLSDSESKRIIEYNDFPALIQAVTHHLDFTRWGFKIVYEGVLLESPHAVPGIILQSEYCKVRIRTFRDRTYEEPEVYVCYGRLHALHEQHVMTWNGEKCYCWHEIDRVLEFLDGLSPQDAFNKRFTRPAFVLEFYEANKDKKWAHPEYMAKMHSAIWKHYGLRLFKVFDLRYPALWQEYTEFLSKYYGLWSDFVADPPMYKIC